ncbi:hypothetical protein [Pararhodobacter marinus]|uniref:hypothetical protein n=1 Tax=Pararhodobacter marinus TaxID=2184063 RepID=UPI003513D9D7
MVPQPTISVNKLAESIVSKAARKRKILMDRKYPDPDFSMGAYHRESSEAIQLYIGGGAVDTAPLDRAHGILNQQTPTKIGTMRRISSNIGSIERFYEMLDDIDLKGAEPELGPSNSPKLKIHNVEVSVRPEIILRGIGPKGAHCVGAIKLHMSKSDNFNEEAAGYASALLQEYTRQFLVQDGEIVQPLYCQVIDVGNRKVFPGVKATAQRMKDIEAECQNIFGLWPTL